MTDYIRKPVQYLDPKAFEANDSTEVYWLSGVSFLLHSHNTNILIDPVLMKAPEDPKLAEIGFPYKIADLPITADQIPENTYVLFTHADKDHMGPLSVKTLADKGIHMCGTFRTFEKLARLRVDPDQLEILRVYEKMNYGDVTIEATQCDHPWQLKDLKRGGRPYRLGECAGFRITTPDGVVWFPGDTRLMEEHLQQDPVDLLILDVSTDEAHLNHTSAVVLANYFADAQIIPFHYGTYDMPHVAAQVGEPEQVYDKIIGAEERCMIPAPGECVKVRKRRG